MSSFKDALPVLPNGVTTAKKLLPHSRAVRGWHLDHVLGRLVELSGGASSAALTLTVGLLVAAQRRGEAVAWVATQETIFFPPDLAACGADLEALPIVRVHRGFEAAQASDRLLRSGGFALIVMDLGQQKSLSLSVQTRLAGLAKRYNTAVVLLTRGRLGSSSAHIRTSESIPHPDNESLRKTGSNPRNNKQRREPSKQGAGLGSLVSLWADCTRTKAAFAHFRCELKAMKDKRQGPGWRHVELCRGPDGLC